MPLGISITAALEQELERLHALPRHTADHMVYYPVFSMYSVITDKVLVDNTIREPVCARVPVGVDPTEYIKFFYVNENALRADIEKSNLADLLSESKPQRIGVEVKFNDDNDRAPNVCLALCDYAVEHLFKLNATPAARRAIVRNMITSCEAIIEQETNPQDLSIYGRIIQIIHICATETQKRLEGTKEVTGVC